MDDAISRVANLTFYQGGPKLLQMIVDVHFLFQGLNNNNYQAKVSRRGESEISVLYAGLDGSWLRNSNKKLVV